MDLIPHDHRRLEAELARAARELADAEAALETYLAGLTAFERRYFGAFASAYAKLDALDVAIAEAQADLRPDDRAKRRKAERLRARLEGRVDETGLEPFEEDDPDDPAPPDDELRTTYRAVAKLIHPDLASDEDERRHRAALMVRVNQAYAAGDMALLAHLAAGAAPPDADSVERRLATTRERQAHAEGRLAAAQATGLARLMRRTAMAASEGLDLFRKLRAELDETTREAEKRLKTLQRRLGKLAQT